MKMETSDKLNILKVYQMANQAADQSQNPDDKIRAYDRVINFCRNDGVCQLDDTIKKSVVLYWSYNNIGDALSEKNDPQRSLQYYLKGLSFARDNLEKISVLNRMAHNYEKLGDRQNWLATKISIVENLKIEERRKAYLALLSEVREEAEMAVLLEKALQSVSGEELSLLAKCQNTLLISSKLTEIYRKRREKKNLKRIIDLTAKTAVLAVKSLEGRIDAENDHEQKLQLLGKLIEIENKFLQPGKARQKEIYRRLADTLGEDELFYYEGRKYTRARIYRKLHQ